MGNLLYSRDESIVTIEISNPTKANSLDMQMLTQLDQHLEVIEADSTVRLLILRGKRGGIFCAGADIRDWSSMTPEMFGKQWLTCGNVSFDRLARLPCITVSVIEGLCFGGGLELALCTDIRIASTEATFCFPEVGIGAFPGWLGGPRLEAVVGRGRAMEMVLLGNKVSAQQGYSYGLVNHLVTPETIEDNVQAIVTRTRQISPRAVATAKGAFFAADLQNYHEQAGIRLRESAEAAEGIQAFFEKRPPHYKLAS